MYLVYDDVSLHICPIYRFRALLSLIYARHHRVTSVLARGWGLCHTDYKALARVPAMYYPVHKMRE